MKRFLPLLLLLACYAKPTESDADRVIQEFTALRFQAPLNSEYAKLTDRQIFEFACRSKRVKCDQVLEIVRTRNPDLYKALNAGEKQ